MKSSKHLGNDIDIQKLCSKIVTHEYKSRGYNSEDIFCKVEINEEDFTVMLNSEKPSLNANFFALVDDVIDEIKKQGFTYSGFKFFFDFCCIKFTK